MIVRMWKGLVPKEKKAAYIDYLHKTGLSDYEKTPGNKGVFLLCRDAGDDVEFTTMTYWDSVASIQRFAGEDYERARYYPEDADFLRAFAPTVDHYEVLSMSNTA
ncbi:MAG: antibiotic biosynthesis monooxygenase [Proteobacteria bacterium]|nr:antibiotic biosynthesis monooxygenase [Pseudomonadota bacterium]